MVEAVSASTAKRWHRMWSDLLPMKWLEIPAHRVLEVHRTEVLEDFDAYDDAGKPCGRGKIYLLF